MRTREELFDRFIEIEAKTPDTMDSIYHLVAEERRAVWEEAAKMLEEKADRSARYTGAQEAFRAGVIEAAIALRARAGEEKP